MERDCGRYISTYCYHPPPSLALLSSSMHIHCSLGMDKDGHLQSTQLRGSSCDSSCDSPLIQVGIGISVCDGHSSSQHWRGWIPSGRWRLPTTTAPCATGTGTNTGPPRKCIRIKKLRFQWAACVLRFKVYHVFGAHTDGVSSVTSRFGH